MQAIGRALLDRLEILRKEKGQQIDIGDVSYIIESLADTLQEDDPNISKEIQEEIEEIAKEFKQLRQDLAVNPDKCDIPSAAEELDAIAKATEEAAHQIMDASEMIQNELNKGSINNASLETINQCIIKIFEACNFQDLTGQRITKVMKTLGHVEKHIDHLMKFFPEAQKHYLRAATSTNSLMEGPQLEKNTPSQDDIDDLFNRC